MSRLITVLTARRSWIVALVGLVLGVLLIGGVGQAERDASALDNLPAGYDSTEGQALLEELPDEGSKTAIVLFTADSDIEASLGDLAQVMEDVAPQGAEPPASGGSESAGPPAGADDAAATGAPADAAGPPAGADDAAATGAPADAGADASAGDRRPGWAGHTPSSRRTTAPRRSAPSPSMRRPPPTPRTSSPSYEPTSPLRCRRASPPR